MKTTNLSLLILAALTVSSFLIFGCPESSQNAGNEAKFYSIIVEQAPAGGVLSASKAQAGAGESIAVTAIAEDKYRLIAIIVTMDSGNSIPVTLNSSGGNFTMPSANVTVTGIFALENGIEYNIAVNQPASGGTISANKTKAAAGETVTITGIPAGGNNLVSVNVTREGGGSVSVSIVSDNVRKFTMPPANVAVTADFISSIEYNITVNQPASGGTISVNKTKAAAGETVNVTGNPAAEYSLGSITLIREDSGVPVFVSITGNTGTFSMPPANATLTAVFVANGSVEYNIAVNQPASGGTISVNKTKAAAGETIAITGIPAGGLSLNSVNIAREGGGTVSASGTGNARNFIMPAANVTITAVFGIPAYTVTVQQPAGGGTISANKFNADAGETITISAVPASGYSLGSVNVAREGGGGVSVSLVSDNVRTFVMPAVNVTVTASFTSNSYSITVQQPSAGGILNVFPLEPSAGETVTVNALCIDGYSLSSVLVSKAGGGTVETTGTGNSRTFTMPADDISLSAVLTAIPYTVTVQQPDIGGTISANPLQTTVGQTITVNSVPAAKYSLGSVTVTKAGGGTVPVNLISPTMRSFMMPADNVTVTAFFAPVPHNVNIQQPAVEGTIAVSLPQAADGESVTVTVTPSDGYNLNTVTVAKSEGGTVPVSGTGNTRTFTMPADHVTVSAAFTAIPYSVTVQQPASGGTIAVSPTQSITVGQTVTVTASPANNTLYLSNVIITKAGGGTVSVDQAGGNTRTFSMPAANVTVTGTFSTQDPSNPIVDGMKIGDYVPGKGTLIWRDEFNGNSLDSAKWNIETGNGSQYGIAGWGNGESQTYNAGNIIVNNGILTLESRRNGTSYTSGRITTGPIRTTSGGSWTPQKLSVKTGRVEARIRTSRGTGFWSAFWLLGSNSYGDASGYPRQEWPRCGEIDILEFNGGEEGRLVQTLHYGENFSHWKYNSAYKMFNDLQDTSTNRRLPGYSQDYHVYGVSWDNQSLSFELNGTAIHTMYYSTLPLHCGQPACTNRTFMDAFYNDAGFSIILNLAIGGNMGGGLPADSAFTDGTGGNTFRVDWVRVFQ